MVSYKTSKAKGAKWQNLKAGKTSFSVPGKATAWKLRLRTPASPLEVYETTRKKTKGGVSLGLKRLLKLLNSPPKAKGKRKYQTVLEFLNERLGQWRLSVGIVPLARYYQDGAFFTNPADLKKKWDEVRIWYAIESAGMSDGSTVADDEKAYHIGYTAFKVKDARIGTALLEKFSDLVDMRLFHRAEDENDTNGIAVQHNSNPNYKQWRETAILLAAEGVPKQKKTGGRNALQGKTGPGRASKRVRVRK